MPDAVKLNDLKTDLARYQENLREAKADKRIHPSDTKMWQAGVKFCLAELKRISND